MNYLIYLGIFSIGAIVGVVIISLLVMDKLNTSNETPILGDHQQFKIDE